MSTNYSSSGTSGTDDKANIITATSTITIATSINAGPGSL